MNVGTRANKVQAPNPPERGIFPLDHLKECTQFEEQYLSCLKHNDLKSRKCRDQARGYLQCRMDKGLMAKEEFDALGFQHEYADPTKNVIKPESPTVAGQYLGGMTMFERGMEARKFRAEDKKKPS